MKCAKCGRELRPDAKFCGVCGEIVKPESVPRSGESMGAYVDRTRAAFSGEREATTPRKPVIGAVNRMPDGIALGVDERIVKEYKVGRYTFRQGDIRVIVTNKRVIRYEESKWFGMQNNQIDEINIDAVHGVSTTMKRSISALGMFFAALFFILSIFLMTDRNVNYMTGGSAPVLGGALLALCALIIFMSLKPTLFFALHGSVGGLALETVVNDRGRIFGKNNAGTVFNGNKLTNLTSKPEMWKNQRLRLF